jgi:hypothetical protein
VAGSGSGASGQPQPPFTREQVRRAEGLLDAENIEKYVTQTRKNVAKMFREKENCSKVSFKDRKNFVN